MILATDYSVTMSTLTNSPVPTAPLAIVGAGPHALTLLARLRAYAPGIADEAVVFDPSGRWLARWCDLFERLEISHLRSPSVHHPHPDVDAISRRQDLRGDDFIGGSSLRPSHRVFFATCSDLIRDLGDCAKVQRHTVTACNPGDTSPPLVRVELDDGTGLEAARVVLATNSARPMTLPGLDPASAQADLRGAEAGEQILVVGGGLTAAQLVEQAVQRGARVTLVTRRPLVARTYDVDPGWMGPKYLRGFSQLADAGERIRVARSARGGGTVPPDVLDRLRALAAEGLIGIREGVAAVAVRSSPTGLVLCLADGTELGADRVVTAMGSVPRADDDPLLAPLIRRGIVRTVSGIPLLDEALRVPGTGLHVMGRLAIERLGPAAGNLAGARRAAARIVADLIGSDPVAADPGVTVDARVWPRLSRASLS